MGLRNVIGKDTWLRTTYRQAKQYHYDRREHLFLQVGLEDVYHVYCDYESPPALLLITVAYNRADMIRHQLRLLPQYLLDSFEHIVVDNSTHEQSRKEIKSVCCDQGIGYVSLPKNFYTHSSSSHGMALNWVHRHLLQKINPLHVGFLDHDIFPIRKHTLLDILVSQPIYGQKQQWGSAPYLWPGFSFYRTALLEGKQIDFKPGALHGTIVDTGGLMPIEAVLSEGEPSLLFAEAHQSSVTGGEVLSLDMIEWLQVGGQDTWLHCIGAGHSAFAKSKEEALNRILASY